MLFGLICIIFWILLYRYLGSFVVKGPKFSFSWALLGSFVPNLTYRRKLIGHSNLKVNLPSGKFMKVQ